MKRYIKMNTGPNRQERRASAKHKLLTLSEHKRKSMVSKRMDRPEKSDIQGRGYMKIQRLFDRIGINLN